MAVQWRPFWVQGDFLNDSGAHSQFDLKALLNVNSKGYWELREILFESRLLHGKGMVHKWVRNHKEDLVSFCRKLGIDFNSHEEFKLNRRAITEHARRANVAPVFPVDTRQEFVVSSGLVLAIMLHVGGCASQNENRVLARTFLESFMRKMLPATDLEQMQTALSLVGFMQCCPLFNADSGCCVHMRSVVDAFKFEELPPQCKLARAFSEASIVSSSCNVAVVWLRDCLPIVTQLIDDQIEGRSYTEDATKAMMLFMEAFWDFVVDICLILGHYMNTNTQQNLGN